MSDDETRRLLQSSDPAASLPPVAPDRVAALLEEAMTENQQPTGSSTRNRVIGVVLAAAAVAAVVIGVNAAGGDDDTQKPVADAKKSVTALTAGGGGSAKCMAPDASVAAKQDVAFEGTVTKIEDGTVTLEATKFWTGKPSDLVTVNAPDMNSSEMPVGFQVGRDYIVGATDGNVSICGLAGLATDDLRSLYDEAFPGK